METESKILELLSNPRTKVDPQWVMEMQRTHPAFMLPALLLLKRNKHDVDPDTRQHLQSVAVLNCADRIALADFIDATSAGWATFYPNEEPRQSSTEETIDDFLQTFGQASTPEEDAVLERLIFNPVVPDYFAGTEEPFDPTDPLALPPELIPEESPVEHFEEPQTSDVEVEVKKEEKESQNAPAPSDESLLMESLAKIFIKQHRYERAFEIISKLSLKYPEKSVYFADQLRFLQKLMINQQYQSK